MVIIEHFCAVKIGHGHLAAILEVEKLRPLRTEPGTWHSKGAGFDPDIT